MSDLPAALEIRLREPLTQTVEWNLRATELLQTRDLDALQNCQLEQSGSEIRFEEIFELQETGEQAECISFRGDLSQLHGLGRGWSAGLLRLEGTVGDSLGEEMSGGRIEVTGEVGHCLGRGMSGGQIAVSGNADNHVGGPAPGSLKGMMGGEIFIAGSAGDLVGERMRRGTIVVLGEVGRQVGREMLAGTILLKSAPADLPGVGMKRGTILLLDQDFPETFPGPHFDYAVRYEPVFIRVLLKHLQQAFGWNEAAEISTIWDRYCGDMLEGGRGEILIAHSA
ncbi:formylmethanofuran dehydrogenase subunit C [Rubinisphaera sp. JC750]|uniref:formylmethanofuran dehydrogenase subunit C n=1 Tax=Rubinisphaera sp. JC750 TaxID=2898658 RepID=UPI001F0171B2|nr:formylmethanofuran dehydrogenase subunit C [Rubinisphaera sp. JC750]